MSFEPFEHEVGLIYDFLDDVYPEAVIMKPTEDVDTEELFRLNQAGFGLADVLHPDGEIDVVTYIRDPRNIVAKAIVALAEAENADEVPEGSHAFALDSIKYNMPCPLLDTFVQLII